MAQRILVVDDDEGMRRMLEMFLAGEGYLVDTAEGVSAAAEVMESDCYRIVVIDNNMAGFEENREGDLELLSRVRSRFRSSSVIIMTGNPIVEPPDRVLEFGAACFMSKPFSLADLRQKIEMLLPEQAGRSLNR